MQAEAVGTAVDLRDPQVNQLEQPAIERPGGDRLAGLTQAGQGFGREFGVG